MSSYRSSSVLVMTYSAPPSQASPLGWSSPVTIARDWSARPLLSESTRAYTCSHPGAPLAGGSQPSALSWMRPI